MHTAWNESAVPALKQLWPGSRVMYPVDHTPDGLTAFSRSLSGQRGPLQVAVGLTAWLEAEFWMLGTSGASGIRLEQPGRPPAFPVAASMASPTMAAEPWTSPIPASP